MRKLSERGSISEKRLLNIKEVCTYIGVGETQARAYMDEIGATKRFGRRVLFDKQIIDEALNRK